MIILIVIEILLFAGFLYFIRELRTYSNMIGLSDEKIILKYSRNNPSEYYWGNISHIVFPKWGEGLVKMITHHGDTVLLRLSRRVVGRLMEFWNKADSE